MPLNSSGENVPFPPVPNVIKLALKFTNSLDLDVIVNTHWSYTGGAPGAAGLATWLGAVDTAVGADLTPLMGTWVKHVGSEATDLSSATGGQAVTTPSQIGTRTGALLPANTAVLFNMKIARRYRGGKPRNYWPFGTDADLQDGSHWTATAQTAFNNGISNWYNALVVGAGAATVTSLVNVSYFKGFFTVKNPVTGRSRNVPTLGPSPPYPYVDANLGYPCSVILGSQRRRLRPG